MVFTVSEHMDHLESEVRDLRKEVSAHQKSLMGTNPTDEQLRRADELEAALLQKEREFKTKTAGRRKRKDGLPVFGCSEDTPEGTPQEVAQPSVSTDDDVQGLGETGDSGLELDDGLDAVEDEIKKLRVTPPCHLPYHRESPRPPCRAKYWLTRRP